MIQREEEYTQNINPSSPTLRRNKFNRWEKKPNLEEMLTKFISVSETRFQNTKTALKNQQALIQGLETQIGQLTKLISERPQRSLSSNTESNPKEELNTITIQDEEGLVKLEPEPRQRIVEIVRKAYMSLVQKPRAHYRPKPRHNELNVSPNQLKVGDKLLLDAADPRIATSEPNRAIPLTVLSIFPNGTVEVIHPKFDTFKVNRTRLKPYFEFDSRNEECKLLAPQ
ncbi:hypothetical protein GOBAR_AA14039 [Gossypium barbadense]|uniref:Uncharacterized protein n=1 Tax=Gossypium barbadense TaxID=3634 RepID=A0A2P5XTL9_GOSBA|nr:hypothetical protein GOBAR_AA14039 [Gossypium barbadense]